MLDLTTATYSPRLILRSSIAPTPREAEMSTGSVSVVIFTMASESPPCAETGGEKH